MPGEASACIYQASEVLLGVALQVIYVASYPLRLLLEESATLLFYDTLRRKVEIMTSCGWCKR